MILYFRFRICYLTFVLKIKDDKNCRRDLVSLGEVLLRFDSGDERIQTTRDFRIFDGYEYNVARNLAKAFRVKTIIATALADNALGRLGEIENLIGGGSAAVQR